MAYCIFMEKVVETLCTPITHECDVLIVGGGVAGIAAALAAARQDTKVILLEKQFMLDSTSQNQSLEKTGRQKKRIQSMLCRKM